MSLASQVLAKTDSEQKTFESRDLLNLHFGLRKIEDVSEISYFGVSSHTKKFNSPRGIACRHMKEHLLVTNHIQKNKEVDFDRWVRFAYESQ